MREDGRHDPERTFPQINSSSWEEPRLFLRRAQIAGYDLSFQGLNPRMPSPWRLTDPCSRTTPIASAVLPIFQLFDYEM